MADLELLQKTTQIATEALTKIDLHMVQCAKASDEMRASVLRLHERMDGRIAANRVMLVSVLIAAAGTLVQVILHFVK